MINSNSNIKRALLFKLLIVLVIAAFLVWTSSNNFVERETWHLKGANQTTTTTREPIDTSKEPIKQIVKKCYWGNNSDFKNKFNVTGFIQKIKQV
jgi:hypothetical protein